MGLIIRLSAFVALATVLVYVGNTLAYRMDMREFGAAFSFSFQMLMPMLFIAGIAAVLGLIGLFARQAGSGLFAILSALILLGCAAGPLGIRHNASRVPPIHDITTDTQTPPQFVAVVPLRAETGATNPPEYDREQTARQLEAYPDIDTVTVDADYGTVFDLSLQVLQEMGLVIVEADEAAGRIEATHTSRWWGFKDDVVIRFNREDTPLTIDMRSKSRIGGSDVGANANRIETFFSKLEARLA
ncbi:DUF1499 domain-containing protein [Parvularcula flava]|uniref:DUF1499 domain-containing protein n=1 Tax=Aquisalinus luteolus TaxID=1566827 RepID=A0A8J3ETL6_9PROT|nr:DUF1499 domain-containing protein [Aquisalinus luteolus]NHK27094.1 DUF1499 domain-containing protein [Aquisalinus luteolus]GGH94353.1 hypothetical protein GCM10011355_08340 [Aquisalinus luteolus]